MSTNHDRRNSLSELGDIASPTLEAAVVQLVTTKHACDALARRRDRLATLAGQGLDFWPDEHNIPGGFCFFRKAFPFTQKGSSDRGTPALVPARRTISNAHRRYSEETTPEQTTLDFLQHPDRAVWNNKEGAKYTWIRPLGLFLAGEGKNRVSLFQRLGIDWIPACVSIEDYPAPERIVLYMTKKAGLERCWAVLDGQFAEYVASPQWILPVLQAYGVKTESRWSVDLPPLTAVWRAHLEIADDQPMLKPRVDLNVVQAREDWENGWIRVSPFSRLPPKTAWKWIAAASAALLTSILLMHADWVWAHWLAAALLGGTVAAFVLGEIEIIPMRRRDVMPSWGYAAWARKSTCEKGSRDGADVNT